ncbi:MAG: phosphate binding protein [Thermoleophilia bacterium]|nr:phosphate binding protein [Thermoleophilia bacterium]
MQTTKVERDRSRWVTNGACAALVAVIAVFTAACGEDTSGGGGSSKDGKTITGSVTADGSSTVFPLSQAVAEEFRNEQGKVEVSVGSSGTGGGFEKFCRGETDISNASRPIKDEEKAACKKGGVEYVELGVATDGVSVVVPKDNDFVDCLTLAQLKQVWAPKSAVKNWKDVDPSFPDKELTLYGPGTDSGTFDYFTEQVNGEEGASRSDYTASEDDNVLVQGVAGDEGALGYFGHGYVVENKDKVRAVQVDGGDGCVEPTTDTITDGTYKPLARPLFTYVAKKAASKPAVKAFVDFELAHAKELSGDVGLVAAPDDTIATSTDDWKTFAKDAAA